MLIQSIKLMRRALTRTNNDQKNKNIYIYKVGKPLDPPMTQVKIQILIYFLSGIFQNHKLSSAVLLLAL